MLFKLASGEDDGSYSYQKFKGPVSGQIREVEVPGANGLLRLDYVAKPDYLFSYGVEDPSTGNSHNHREIRDGDVVVGEYRVLQADGILRIVEYTADAENGFRAKITYKRP